MMKACVLCGSSLSDELTWRQIFSLTSLEADLLCEDCRESFRPFERSEIACQSCQRPLLPLDQVTAQTPWWQQAQELAGGLYCPDCVHWSKTCPTDYLHHHSLLTYTPQVREWFYQYKYRGDARLARVVVKELSQAYRMYADYTWLVLPSQPQVLAGRHFHPTSHLLTQAGIPHEIPFDYIGQGLRQAQKSRRERLEVSMPFALKKDHEIPKKSLIFDDVYTTGATMQAAKKCLYQHESAPKDLEILSLSLALDILT